MNSTQEGKWLCMELLSLNTDHIPLLNYLGVPWQQNHVVIATEELHTQKKFKSSCFCQCLLLRHCCKQVLIFNLRHHL